MSSSEGLTRRKKGGEAAQGAPTASDVDISSKADDAQELNKGHGPAADAITAPAVDDAEDEDTPASSVGWLERHERWVPFLLLLITGFTRYYRLDKPTGVVFDEFHFGRFTNQYHAGTYLFDIQ